MAGKRSDTIILDGPDWEADWFQTEEIRRAWNEHPRNLRGQLMESAYSSGFITGAATGAMRGNVPGCDRSFLLENGRIQDPYHGRNLEMSRWAEQYEWGFRKIFRVPDSWKKFRSVRLILKGIDYEADIYLNGEALGSHRGMFLPAEFEVSTRLRCGRKNLLALVFRRVPSGNPDHREGIPADFAAYHRCQMSFGWDWARGMVAAGIWDSILLRGFDTAQITDLFFRGDSAGNVRLSLEIESLDACVLPLEIHLKPFNFNGRIHRVHQDAVLHQGRNCLNLDFRVENVRCWNPRPCGFPALYSLEVRLDGRIERRRVGFRDLEMLRNPGSPEDAYPLTFSVIG